MLIRFNRESFSVSPSLKYFTIVVVDSKTLYISKIIYVKVLFVNPFFFTGSNLVTVHLF